MSETVDGTALTLESVDNIQSGDRLALGVLAVQGGILDDTFEEHAEGAAGLIVDQTGQTLDTTSARHTTDGGLGDTLNVFIHDLGVALSTGFALTGSVSFATFAHASLATGLAVAQLRATDLARHDFDLCFEFW